MEKLRVGIVGCGEATQILHLPSLYQLSEHYEVTALCDISNTVVNGVADRWNIAARHHDYAELVQRSDVDIVLIANPHVYHAEVTLAAAGEGKHVMVEKPMCITTKEADRVIAAANRAGTTVQVGYMRRYAPAFIEACERVASFDAIRFARVHAVIGANAQIIDPTSRVIRGKDIPKEILEASGERQQESVYAAIGDVPDDVATAYLILLGLSSHDLSAMREIIGMPKRVLYSAQRQGGRYISAAFDYGDYVCHFETGIDNIARFDAHIEVYGSDEMIRVDYDTPYVRNLPTTLTTVWAKSSHEVHRKVSHGWNDNFTEEWRELYRTIVEKEEPKSSPEDFRNDLVLFKEIVDSIQGAQS